LREINVALTCELLNATTKSVEKFSAWAERVADLISFHESLADYLKDRMNAVAPNLQALIGEIVGSKLIAHAGGLTRVAPSRSVEVQFNRKEQVVAGHEAVSFVKERPD
jgi:RNA processing factor Prp31